jgi:hypothetical protein
VFEELTPFGRIDGFGPELFHLVDDEQARFVRGCGQQFAERGERARARRHAFDAPVEQRLVFVGRGQDADVDQ